MKLELISLSWGSRAAIFVGAVHSSSPSNNNGGGGGGLSEETNLLN